MSSSQIEGMFNIFSREGKLFLLEQITVSPPSVRKSCKYSPLPFSSQAFHTQYFQTQHPIYAHLFVILEV